MGKEENKENSEKDIKEPARTGLEQVERNEDGTFKEGFSGNPNGRVKGSKDFSTVFGQAIKKIAKSQNLKEDEIEVDLIIMAIAEAKKGKYQFWRELFDRNYGKPQQKMDLTSGGDKINPDLSKIHTDPEILEIEQQYNELIKRKLIERSKARRQLNS